MSSDVMVEGTRASCRLIGLLAANVRCSSGDDGGWSHLTAFCGETGRCSRGEGGGDSLTGPDDVAVVSGWSPDAVVFNWRLVGVATGVGWNSVTRSSRCGGDEDEGGVEVEGCLVTGRCTRSTRDDLSVSISLTKRLGVVGLSIGLVTGTVTTVEGEEAGHSVIEELPVAGTGSMAGTVTTVEGGEAGHSVTEEELPVAGTGSMAAGVLVAGSAQPSRKCST